MMESCCRHCKEYYKKGIHYNVESFKKRLEKGPNALTKEEKQEKNVEEPDQEDDTAEEVRRENPDAFLVALNAINDW